MSGVVEVRLHRRIYDAGAVKAAVEHYAEVAEVALDDDGDYHVARFSEMREDIESLIADEFANAALLLTVQDRF